MIKQILRTAWKDFIAHLRPSSYRYTLTAQEQETLDLWENATIADWILHEEWLGKMKNPKLQKAYECYKKAMDKVLVAMPKDQRTEIEVTKGDLTHKIVMHEPISYGLKIVDKNEQRTGDEVV